MYYYLITFAPTWVKAQGIMESETATCPGRTFREDFSLADTQTAVTGGLYPVLLSQVVGSSFAFLLYPMSKRCLMPLFFLLTLWAPLLFSISLSRRFYNCTAARSGVFSQFATPSLLCSCGCSIRSFSLQSLFCFRSFLKPEQGIRWSIPHSLYCAYPLSSLPNFPPVLYYHILFVVSRTMSKQK